MFLSVEWLMLMDSHGFHPHEPVSVRTLHSDAPVVNSRFGATNDLSLPWFLGGKRGDH